MICLTLSMGLYLAYAGLKCIWNIHSCHPLFRRTSCLSSVGQRGHWTYSFVSSPNLTELKEILRCLSHWFSHIFTFMILSNTKPWFGVSNSNLYSQFEQSITLFAYNLPHWLPTRRQSIFFCLCSALIPPPANFVDHRCFITTEMILNGPQSWRLEGTLCLVSLASSSHKLHYIWFLQLKKYSKLVL